MTLSWMIRAHPRPVDMQSRASSASITLRKGYRASFSVIRLFEFDKEPRSVRESIAMEEHMNKILIVDEEDAIRMLYQEELEEDGYDLTATEDYDALLEIIAEKQPDLVVLDVKRNGSNGLDILQEIRTAFSDIPIILCTAYDALRYDAKIAAANYFMIKSWDLSRLKHAVGLAMEAGEKTNGETQRALLRELPCAAHGVGTYNGSVRTHPEATIEGKRYAT
jgi:CheY-like chemotaxis protein